MEVLGNYTHEHSTTELHPHPFKIFVLRQGLAKLPRFNSTCNPLASASWVAGITDFYDHIQKDKALKCQQNLAALGM